MIYRCIAPQWLLDENTNLDRTVEGELTGEEITELNGIGYNIYFLPNHPSIYNPGTTVDGSQIDVFNYVFVDMDLKDKQYSDKEQFIAIIKAAKLDPTFIVDSGGGVHVYWLVKDLDPMSYLKLQRRLMRKFKTDEAVGQIFQLMRAPGTINTKVKDNLKICDVVYETTNIYTCEELDHFLDPLSKADEEYCKRHFDKTFNPDKQLTEVDTKIPFKFAKLIDSNPEVKDIWSGNVEDRSAGDYRLGHLMFANGFSKDEAMSVLVNSAKALGRAPIHRISYASGIVDKIWTFEITEDKSLLDLSSSVKEILERSESDISGTRLSCYKYFDNTACGLRLGHVIGLVGGSGVGKTEISLNMFKGFVQNNPDYDHLFVTLEQPKKEIAERWERLCGEDTQLHSKVHIISNFNDNGDFLDLSLEQIRQYVFKFQKITGKKLGSVVIDHIAVLSNNDKHGHDEGVKKLCKAMKVFAVTTNTLLVMQSQTSREKAGIGDLELNKDAAFGTSVFENYCDYLITIWQPLKRCYDNPECPTVTSFKFCKIRHKKQNVDIIKEDVRYVLYFDPNTGNLRELTQQEDKSFDYFNKQATNRRKTDRKTDVLTYTSVKWDAADTAKGA